MVILFRKAFWLAVVLCMTAGQAVACSDYVHLWRPISEDRSQSLAPAGIALFIDHVYALLKEPDKRYQLSVNPASEAGDDLKTAIRESAALVSGARVFWHDIGSPFEKGTGSATIWLDFVKPERMVYLWVDQNKPPFAIFRCGEVDTARVRVLVQNSEGKVTLIDEFPYLFLLESDFMLPSWLSCGGVWFRRLSFKTAQMSQRHEWTLSVPSDVEDINQTPSDVRRFFFGDLPSDSVQIYSNY
ncbi:MAG: hypothetical protein A2W80_17160 [Candidatus Riflebacteria bacterium GWC2_50_8]|nr:MAG: hypothetical protein A2W80_17160 [Candidatus Riflebacteria bacterium GWC2_50_8]